MEPEEHHSIQSLQVTDELDENSSVSEEETTREENPDNCQGVPDSRKKRVKWPKGTDTQTWQEFDEDASKLLATTLSGGVDKKVNSLTSIVYNMGLDRFGSAEMKERNPHLPNRREKEISQLRGELRELRRQHRRNPEDQGLKDLREVLRGRIIILRRAENHRKNRHKRSKTRKQFIQDPYKFVKK